MCRVFDPVSFDKNDGASPPVLAVGPDWPDLDFFFSTKNPGSDSDCGALAKIRPRLGSAAGPDSARGLSWPRAAIKSAFGLQGAPRAPVWPAGQTGLKARLACRPDSIHRRHTCIQLLDRNPTTSQKSNYVTKTQLLNKNPTTQQKPNYPTDTRRCHKNPTIPQKPDYVTKTRLSHRHPTVPQTPDVSPDTR